MSIGTARIYRLVHPGRFEIVSADLGERLPEGTCLVRPTWGSICAADLRYYLGRRRPEALAKKLPMALLHEAVGVVEESAHPGFVRGDRVVLVPNIPGYLHSPDEHPDPEHCCPACASDEVGENYCAHSHFLSSGHDGFTTSLAVHPGACLAKVPAGLPSEVAVLSELASVCLGAVLRTLGLPRAWEALSFAGERGRELRDAGETGPENAGEAAGAAAQEAAAFREQGLGVLGGARIGVWGDGPVGYSVATWLSFLGVPRERLVVFGTTPSKLEHFDFATTVDISDRQAVAEARQRWMGRFAAAFECVGGEMQSVAANDAIDHLQPGGRLGLLGVTEGLTPLNVRDVLEKGITMAGCSRSPRQSYPPVVGLLARSAFLQEHFRRLSLPPLPVQDVQGLEEAFHFASGKAEWGKVIMKLDL